LRYTASSQLCSEVAKGWSFLARFERGINAPSFEALEQMATGLRMAVRELFDFRKR
jgi:transcriptional regulator with XRE-family HTH domain